MIEVKIPDNLFEGKECLPYGVPWQTEGSIHKENENITNEDIAFELGTGGSTIFLARRCKHVIAVETSHEWSKDVVAALDNDGLENVTYKVLPDEADIIAFIKDFDTSPITIFSVDTQGGYGRSAMLDAFLSKGVSPNLKMIVLDNYGHEGLFPNHWDKDNFMGENWDVFTYPHERWAGGGSRLYIKKQKQ